MRTNNTSLRTIDPVDQALAGATSHRPEPRPASIHLLNSATSSRPHRDVVRTRFESGTAELLADIDGVPVLVRFVVKGVAPEMQSDPDDVNIQRLLSNTLQKMVDRMRGPFPRRHDQSKPPFAVVELTSSSDSPVRQPSRLNDAVLRVGPLQLDLMDRIAKRDSRQIDLRPREFQLLKYMMERSDKLLTRAALFKEVWNYKFTPESNLVDVHMGRLRRKVDGRDDAPMIRSVRGAGFVLSATPFPHRPRTLYASDLL
jgi:DNA-binding winged helix-turn-helix (wHTH) protein